MPSSCDVRSWFRVFLLDLTSQFSNVRLDGEAQFLSNGLDYCFVFGPDKLLIQRPDTTFSHHRPPHVLMIVGFPTKIPSTVDPVAGHVKCSVRQTALRSDLRSNFAQRRRMNFRVTILTSNNTSLRRARSGVGLLCKWITSSHRRRKMESTTPIPCSICGKAVDLRDCKSDGHGSPVHEICYAAKLATKSTLRPREIDIRR